MSIFCFNTYSLFHFILLFKSEYENNSFSRNIGMKPVAISVLSFTLIVLLQVEVVTSHNYQNY